MMTDEYAVAKIRQLQEKIREYKILNRRIGKLYMCDDLLRHLAKLATYEHLNPQDSGIKFMGYPVSVSDGSEIVGLQAFDDKGVPHRWCLLQPLVKAS